MSGIEGKVVAMAGIAMAVAAGGAVKASKTTPVDDRGTGDRGTEGGGYRRQDLQARSLMHAYF